MYSYFVPDDALPLAIVSPVFFVAVAGAGAAGAFVSLHLVRAGRTKLAVVNVLFGLGLWIALWLATWDRYFHIGTYESYHAGLAPHLSASPGFQLEMNVAGALQGAAGLACAAWLVLASRRATRLAATQPDPAPHDWRGIAEGPSLQPAPVPSPVQGGEIRGARPIDGAPLPPVALTTDIPAVLTRARRAQLDWAEKTPRERARLLREVGKRFLARAEELAALLESENGRPRAESYFTEILPNADLFSYWTKKGPLLLQAEAVELDPILFPGKRGVVEPLPRGVVGVISPWNFPISLPLRTLLPALLAGNAVVLKPSEFGARSGAFLGELFAETLPPDLVQVVQGGGEAGRALIEAGVDFLTFIGSPRTGRSVARLAAERLTPVSLELGGKDAAIVLADADLERAANGIVWGAFANAGQNCAAVERCYVVRGIADAFVEKLRQRVAELRVGPGPEGAVDVGPLTTPAQKAMVEAQLAQAGIAPRTSGLHLEPVLVVDPPEDLALLREETFGPILPVVTVADEDEAVRRANDSPYGLTASVWSRDTRKAEALARRLHAGVVTVNNHAFTGGLAQAPWSGVRGSGHGVTNSPQALAELTRPRFVLVDASRSRRELWWYPYDRAALQLGRSLARLRAGEIAAVKDVVTSFMARLRSTPAPVDRPWPGQMPAESGRPALQPEERRTGERG